MIIFVEGPDGSGKTTLVKDLVKLGCKLSTTGDTHPDSPNRITETVYYETLLKHAQSPEIYVADRSPLTDILYRVFDSKSPLLSFSHFNDLLRQYPCRMIYCKTNESKKNAVNDENPVVREQYDMLAKLYEFLIGLLPTTLLHYDYKTKVPGQLILELYKEELNEKFC